MGTHVLNGAIKMLGKQICFDYINEDGKEKRCCKNYLESIEGMPLNEFIEKLKKAKKVKQIISEIEIYDVDIIFI